MALKQTFSVWIASVLQYTLLCSTSVYETIHRNKNNFQEAEAPVCSCLFLMRFGQFGSSYWHLFGLENWPILVITIMR